MAYFNSSSTNTAAPSPITKPSLLLSKGREAVSGASLNLIDNALALANPATDTGVIAASVPPHNITSASPFRINLIASPIEWAPVVHAVDTAWLGPWSPYFILICPAAIFINIFGTK